MFDLDRWDVVLLAVAGYIAVVSLTRMMARHRDRLVVDLQQQAAAEQKRQRAEARRKKELEQRQSRQKQGVA